MDLELSLSEGRVVDVGELRVDAGVAGRGTRATLLKDSLLLH